MRPDYGRKTTAQAENCANEGWFLRQINLGQGIDVEHISANYTNGVLSVTLPVTERAKPRRIEVSTGSDEHMLTVKEHDLAERSDAGSTA
jgi:hypothetical protein